jgi:dynamin GTPase
MSAGSGSLVTVSPKDLQDILQRLSEKRAAVEKELAAIPNAPKASKDIFQLCRGFERAFSATIDSVDYSAAIRGAFSGDDGLKGVIAKLPLEKKFKLDNVKAVVREADGFQRSLVSPEAGLRRLVSDCVETVLDPVSRTVMRIHMVLLNVARDAARKASGFSEATTYDETREPLRLPGFEKQVIFAAQKALEQWREEALIVAKTLVNMEQSYVTAAFFRHRTKDRYEQMNAQRATAELLQGGGVQDTTDDEDSGDEDSVRRTDSSPAVKRNELQTYSASSSALSGPLAGGLTIPQAQTNNDDPGDLKTGYLEKRVGEHSGRQSVPGEAFKWQKRYFVLTEPKGMLYYFKSADDPPNYRGVINLRECRVEDVDVDGTPKTSGPRSKTELADLSAVSLLIKIGHKDATRPIVKNHHSVVLRAETAAEKYSWLARLKNASDGTGQRTPVKQYKSDDLLRKDSEKDSKKDRKERPSPQPSFTTVQPGTPKTQVAASGIGGSMLFHESSGIGPEPMLYNSPNGSVANPNSSSQQQVQDLFLMQLAEDTAAYVRTVCNTLVLTVPKAIVHCQVKRAQNHLLEALYAHISSLSQFETEVLLEESPEIVQRRAATTKALKDLEEAVAELRSSQEQIDPADRNAKLPVDAQLLELAGMRKLIPSDQRSERSGGMYGDYTPSALAGNGSPENGVIRSVMRGNSGGRREYAQPPSPQAGPGVTTLSNSSQTNRPPSGKRVSPRTTLDNAPAAAAPQYQAAPAAPAGAATSPGGVVPRRRPPPAPPGGQQ